MKVFRSWEIIQLFVESGEATGKTWLRRKQNLATSRMISIVTYTWHGAKIAIITDK
jgi:hypothetical protein